MRVIHSCVSGRYAITVCDILIHEEFNTSGKVQYYYTVPHTDLSLDLVSSEALFLLFTRNIHYEER